jgi:hypothetical protein
MADDTNVLALIAGDCIGNAARSLLDATTVEDDTREVTIHVPGPPASLPGSRSVGSTSGRWFWTVESAVKVR